MSLPTPPTRAHIPASSFPAIETPPSAQGISSSSPSPFQSPDISRPPSPSQVNSSRPTASRGTSQVPSEDSRWAASRSGSLSKDPLVKKSRPFVASPSLWERVKGLVPGSGAAAEEQRGRRPSVLAEGGERMVQQDGRWKVGWPMSREKAQLVLSFAMIALVGMNDSATGANLDSMQTYYEVSYDKISIVFLANVAGYFISCLSSSFLTHHLGLSKSLLFASATMSLGCGVLAFAPPFGVFVLALGLLGFGSGLYDACLTTVVSHEEDGVLMSCLYAFFGVGATFSPLLIGGFIDAGLPWARYYWVPLSISLSLAVIGHFVFSTYEAPADEHHPTLDVPMTNLAATGSRSSGEVVHGRAIMSVQTRMRRVLGLKVAWVGFLLIILSFATLDTLSAWVVSYLIEVRQSPEASSRYILSGLWAGIASGRVVLAFALAKRMGERSFAVLMLVLASGLLGITMAVRSFIVDAVAIAFAGFFLGPVTPQVLSVVAVRVPPSLKSSIISLTVGLGLIGSSVGPLLFGVAAGKGALGTLPVVLIVASVMAAGSWIMIPKNVRRED